MCPARGINSDFECPRGKHFEKRESKRPEYTVPVSGPRGRNK
jgi:hypothetical protein